MAVFEIERQLVDITGRHMSTSQDTCLQDYSPRFYYSSF